MSLRKVTEIARGEIGTTENPAGSNRVKYWEDYDPGWQGQPWCVAFLWWCFRQAGESAAFFGGAKTASCGKLLRWYREQDQTAAKQDIREGDIAFFNFNGAAEPEHCGYVTHVERSGGSVLYVKSIEGNTTTTGGSESNGGIVAEKSRFPRNIVGVARPKYQPEKPEAEDDFTGRWSEEDIRYCLDNGIMTGYPDGNFRPTQGVTREELAAVARRIREA